MFKPDNATLAKLLMGTGIKPPAGGQSLQPRMGGTPLSPQARIDRGFDALSQPQPSMAVDWGYVPKRGNFPMTAMQAQASMGEEMAMQPQQRVPMPMPRPQAAPQQVMPQQPQQDMSWFMRNAYMQRDPMSGEYLDPRLAAIAQGQPV